jgi:hypothetical protein
MVFDWQTPESGGGVQSFPGNAVRTQVPDASHVPVVAVHPLGLGSEHGPPTFIGVV